LNPLNWLIVAAIIYAVWKTSRSIRSSGTQQERSLAMRGAAAFWLLGFLVIGALVFLPNRGRVLFAIPAFLLGSAAVKAYRNSRQRLRQQEEDRANFERMKRVN
jgi:hypothetical protein